MDITKFRKKVIEGLVEMPLQMDFMPAENQHVLEEAGKKQICSSCYRENVAELGRKLAKNRTSKTKFRCNECSKFLCLSCFFVLHNAKSI
ncbi:unnamed protein product [Ceutorhynchus assimilis]|uniref:PiggyBac transposable element-derived protein 4 C-terminal zinc-ribbon domain-containing protein n=1 Tax=Ceutorhynchus assimilis TaxID=467358 RepID=A0A9N9MKP0_9CUCU|nr:unnamed protein product [Ceutorhynchus assimilis]